ncbi:MAG: hypothetical protein NC241_00605 [Bacteroides sp.]|nr:hypothetical protein [Bacteroides sp.]MCM1457088.1 hypothetical protein [Lachnoclostridium sp.]
MPIKENRRFTPLSAVLLMLLLAAWACSYITLPMYQNISDEPYQIMCGWDYRSSVAAPLSAWLTSVIGPLWNFDNFPFRIMGWTLQVISVLIGMLPAWWMSRNINFTLGAGALSIFLFSLCRCLEATFSWDSYAVPTLMVVTVLCFTYYIKPKWWKIATMGVCCGILLTLRLPSGAAILLPIIALLCADGVSKKFAIRLCALLAIYAFTVFAILTLLYGSIGYFIKMVDSDLISDHEPGVLFKIYIWTTLLFYLYILGAAGLCFVMRKLISDRASVITTVAIAACVSLGFYFFIHENWSVGDRAYLFSPLYIVTELYLVWKTSGNARYGAIILLVTSLLGGFGSNIIIARFLVYPTMPILLFYLVQAIRSRSQVAAFSALWIPMLITNYIVVTYTFCNLDSHSIQHPLYKNTTVPHMDGMYVTESESNRIHRIVNCFMPFVNDTTYNTAVMRNTPGDFIFEYIFNSRTPIYQHWWKWKPLILNKDYTDRFTHWIESSDRPVAVLMVRYQDTLDGPEEDIIGEYKRRYRTVYSDSIFTIVIKDVNQGK